MMPTRKQTIFLVIFSLCIICCTILTPKRPLQTGPEIQTQTQTQIQTQAGLPNEHPLFVVPTLPPNDVPIPFAFAVKWLDDEQPANQNREIPIQPASDDFDNLPEVDEFVTTVMLLHATIPVPDMKGSDSRILQVIRAYKDSGVHVIYACARREEGETEEHHTHLKNMGVEVHCPISGTQAEFAMKLAKRNVSLVTFFLWPDPCFLYWLKRLLQVCRMQFGFVTMPISDDVLAERSTEWVVQELEGYFWSHSDMIGCLSQHICDAAQRIAPTKPRFLVRYVFSLDVPIVQHADFDESEDLIFVGYSNAENNFAMEWFADEGMKRVAKLSKGSIKFHLYGKVLCVSCDTTNYVIHHQTSEEEVQQALQRAKVFIAPVLSPVGISTKIIRALASGLPVITSTHGANFVDIAPGSNPPLHVARCRPDDALCFGEEAYRLYKESTYWRHLSSKGPLFVQQNFAFGPLLDDIDAVLNHLDTLKPSSEPWEEEYRTRNRVYEIVMAKCCRTAQHGIRVCDGFGTSLVV